MLPTKKTKIVQNKSQKRVLHRVILQTNMQKTSTRTNVSEECCSLNWLYRYLGVLGLNIVKQLLDPNPAFPYILCLLINTSTFKVIIIIITSNIYMRQFRIPGSARCLAFETSGKSQSFYLITDLPARSLLINSSHPP